MNTYDGKPYDRASILRMIVTLYWCGHITRGEYDSVLHYLGEPLVEPDVLTRKPPIRIPSGKDGGQ